MVMNNLKLNWNNIIGSKSKFLMPILFHNGIKDKISLCFMSSEYMDRKLSLLINNLIKQKILKAKLKSQLNLNQAVQALKV